MNREDLLKGKSNFILCIQPAFNPSGDGTGLLIRKLEEMAVGTDTVFVLITNRPTFMEYAEQLTNEDFIVFNHCYRTGITDKEILDACNKSNCLLYTIIHDQYFFMQAEDALVTGGCGVDVVHKQMERITSKSSIAFLDRTDIIVFNSQYPKSCYKNHPEYQNKSMVLPLPDLEINYDYVNIPKLDKTIKLGIITNVTECKGYSIYMKLFKINKYKDYDVQFHIFGYSPIFSEFENVYAYGRYKENAVFKLLETRGIHGLLFMNNYPETYCYALTKGINSGLPIYYSPIGSFVERLSSREMYLPAKNGLEELSIFKYLDYVIRKQGTQKGEYVERFKVADEWYSLFRLKRNVDVEAR